MTKTGAFIITSADQVPRRTALKRFPISRDFGMSPGSRIERGRTWPAPAGASRVKAFEIYRYDPDSGDNPRLDTFEVDLDDCRSEEHTSELQSLLLIQYAGFCLEKKTNNNN